MLSSLSLISKCTSLMYPVAILAQCPSRCTCASVLMAVKRKASKAKAKKAAKKPADEADEEDKMDQDSAAKARRTQRSRRDTDQKVQRALELHFNHFPKFLIENKLIDGLSLRQRIAADMEHMDGTKARLGTKYWVQLRAQYGGSLDPCANLQVKDINEKISDSLVSALQHFTSTNPAARTAEPLISFLSQQACHAQHKTLTPISYKK